MGFQFQRIVLETAVGVLAGVGVLFVVWFAWYEVTEWWRERRDKGDKR